MLRSLPATANASQSSVISPTSGCRNVLRRAGARATGRCAHSSANRGLFPRFQYSATSGRSPRAASTAAAAIRRASSGRTSRSHLGFASVAPGSVERSEVECELGAGAAAADEDSSVGRRFEGFGTVSDLAGEQAALAVVADAVAAREADRHVAGFGEVEQARVLVVPPHGEVAAGEGDGRAGAGWAVGRVRRPV